MSPPFSSTGREPRATPKGGSYRTLPRGAQDGAQHDSRQARVVKMDYLTPEPIRGIDKARKACDLIPPHICKQTMALEKVGGGKGGSPSR